LGIQRLQLHLVHGESIASGSYDKTIKNMELITDEIRQLGFKAGGHTHSPDGQILVSGNHNCEIKYGSTLLPNKIQAF